MIRTVRTLDGCRLSCLRACLCPCMRRCQTLPKKICRKNEHPISCSESGHRPASALSLFQKCAGLLCLSSLKGGVSSFFRVVLRFLMVRPGSLLDYARYTPGYLLFHLQRCIANSYCSSISLLLILFDCLLLCCGCGAQPVKYLTPTASPTLHRSVGLWATPSSLFSCNAPVGGQLSLSALS